MSAHEGEGPGPIRVALVNDYDVVVLGLARILERYEDRLVIAEIDTNEPVEDVVDLVLYDAFAQPESDRGEIGSLVANPRAGAVVVYTWNLHPELVDRARSQGARGYLSKALPARDLVDALEAVHGGEIVISEPERTGARAQRVGLAGSRGGPDRPRVGGPGADHPGDEQRRGGRPHLPQPQHDQDLHPLHLPKDRVESRTQAVLWGVEHGFQPDKRRIEHWRGGP